MTTNLILATAIVLFISVLLFLKRKKTFQKLIVNDLKPNKFEHGTAENEHPIKEASIEPVVETMQKESFTFADGESEYYKEKLKDERWIEKSNEIKKRDKYLCQHCFGIIELERIDEISKYVDYPEVAEVIIDIFDNKDKYIENLGQLKHKHYGTMPVIGSGLILNFIIEDSLFARDSVELFAKKDLFNKDVLGKLTYSVQPKYFRYNKNEPDKRTNIIGLEYFRLGDTDGKIIIRHRNWYKKDLDYAKQCVLSQDGFSIIYPLCNLNTSPLNVHHKAYCEGKEPWESPDEDLITLCEVCHKAEHKRLENKIPVKQII